MQGLVGVCSDSAASIQTVRDFERFLRQHGFSRRRATAVALHGFCTTGEKADVATILREVANMLDSRNNLV